MEARKTGEQEDSRVRNTGEEEIGEGLERRKNVEKENGEKNCRKTGQEEGSRGGRLQGMKTGK